MIKNKLHYYMRKTDMNISQLSEETKISRNTLSSLLNKGSELTAFKTKTIEVLCAYFGITIGDLLIYVDDTIKVKEMISLKPEKEFEETLDKKRFYNYRIKVSLENEYKKTYDIELKVQCSTGFRTDFAYDFGGASSKEQFPYNLYEVEIDQKFPNYRDNSLSEDNVRNLMTLTNFFAEKIFIYLPELIDKDYLNLSKNPFSNVKLKYISYLLEGATFEKDYFLFVNEEKELKYLPNV